MPIQTRGKDPSQYYLLNKRYVLASINAELATLLSELVQATPVGVSSFLKQGWSQQFATEARPVAILSQNQAYFLPVELGRRPGKGISVEGQEDVMDWSKRVLGLDYAEQKSFAFNLSRKYQKFGRPAQGFAGLAKPGDPARSPDSEIEPINGGLIQKSFSRIERRLKQTPPI